MGGRAVEAKYVSCGFQRTVAGGWIRCDESFCTIISTKLRQYFCHRLVGVGRLSLYASFCLFAPLICPQVVPAESRSSHLRTNKREHYVYVRGNMENKGTQGHRKRKHEHRSFALTPEMAGVKPSPRQTPHVFNVSFQYHHGTNASFCRPCSLRPSSTCVANS